jgi:hypothetical protein
MMVARRKREMRKEVVNFIVVVCVLKGLESDVFWILAA